MILLLHALLLEAARWDEQLRWFGERHRVMAPDLKGFGGSDAPEDPAAYSVESYNGEQQHWIRVEDDLHLLINRRVDQLVGRETSRRAEAVRLARRLMGTDRPARPNRGPRSDQPVAHLAQGPAHQPGDVHGEPRSRQGGVESIAFVVSRPGPGDETALDALAGPV